MQSILLLQLVVYWQSCQVLKKIKSLEQPDLEQKKLKPVLKQLEKRYQVRFKLAKQCYEQLDAAELPLAFSP